MQFFRIPMQNTNLINEVRECAAHETKKCIARIRKLVLIASQHPYAKRSGSRSSSRRKATTSQRLFRQWLTKTKRANKHRSSMCDTTNPIKTDTTYSNSSQSKFLLMQKDMKHYKQKPQPTSTVHIPVKKPQPQGTRPFSTKRI